MHKYASDTESKTAMNIQLHTYILIQLENDRKRYIIDIVSNMFRYVTNDVCKNMVQLGIA